jgi:hypothetical protein
MSRHFKIDEVLSGAGDELRAEYDALIRKPATTIDDLLEWLGERGFKVSRGAVWKHKKNFEDTLADVRQAAEMARAFTAVVKESGVAGMNDAIMAKFQQLQMQWAFAQVNGGELTPEDMERFAKSMNQAASAAQRNEDLRSKFNEAMKAIQTKANGAAGNGKITDEDIQEAGRKIFGGGG